MHILCITFEAQRVICQKSQIFPTLCVVGAPLWVIPLEFKKELCLCDAVICSFD